MAIPKEYLDVSARQYWDAESDWFGVDARAVLKTNAPRDISIARITIEVRFIGPNYDGRFGAADVICKKGSKEAHGAFHCTHFSERNPSKRGQIEVTVVGHGDEDPQHRLPSWTWDIP